MNNRAKTTDQKDQIIRRLKELWLKNPNLRLTQLLENVFHHTSTDHCFYYVEDFEFIEALEKYYESSHEKESN